MGDTEDQFKVRVRCAKGQICLTMHSILLFLPAHSLTHLRTLFRLFPITSSLLTRLPVHFFAPPIFGEQVHRRKCQWDPHFLTFSPSSFSLCACFTAKPKILVWSVSVTLRFATGEIPSLFLFLPNCCYTESGNGQWRKWSANVSLKNTFAVERHGQSCLKEEEEEESESVRGAVCRTDNVQPVGGR